MRKMRVIRTFQMSLTTTASLMAIMIACLDVKNSMCLCGRLASMRYELYALCVVLRVHEILPRKRQVDKRREFLSLSHALIFN
jgi:hypothetical protein